MAKGYWNATRDPIIRTAAIEVADWPEGAPPIKLLLISDIHVAGPDMPPERLVHLVRQFNGLRPDLVLIGGDLVSERRASTHHYTPEEIVAPLGGLRVRLGTVVALGNHDHWFDPARLTAELRRHDIVVLANDAVRRGPLIIGGVDDDYSGHDDLAATYTAMDALGSGPHILVTHSPDIVPDLPQPVSAVFAGHTHCGQIRLPLIGAVSYVSRYGDRFACGDMTDHGQRLFVGAGLGTSIVPLRYGAPPDAWLVTMHGRSAQ
ncbi:MAG: metallophosphoesterase [Sphingopyxis sp.]